MTADPELDVLRAKASELVAEFGKSLRASQPLRTDLDDIVWVYMLIDYRDPCPDPFSHHPFYIGITNNITRRLKQHEFGKSDVAARIAAIRASGDRPRLRLIRQGPRVECEYVEATLIITYIVEGVALLNKSLGALPEGLCASMMARAIAAKIKREQKSEREVIAT